MANPADTMNNLLVSNVPEISKAAKRANQYLEELEGNKITPTEYDDLIDDLIRLDRIDKSMVTLEVYREIVKAYQYLATLKSLTSLL